MDPSSGERYLDQRMSRAADALQAVVTRTEGPTALSLRGADRLGVEAELSERQYRHARRAAARALREVSAEREALAGEGPADLAQLERHLTAADRAAESAETALLEVRSFLHRVRSQRAEFAGSVHEPTDLDHQIAELGDGLDSDYHLVRVAREQIACGHLEVQFIARWRPERRDPISESAHQRLRRAQLEQRADATGSRQPRVAR